MLHGYLDLLAQLPESDVYVNPFKLGAIVAVFVIWAYFAQWVDKDTIAVNTYRELWNLIVMAAGVAAVALGLLVPSFLIGFLVMVALVLAIMVAYVVHRNGLVKPEDTVCTLAHFQRMREEGILGKKKKVAEVKERVRVTGANHSVVAIPEDEVEREQYRLMQDLLFDTLWRHAAVVDVTPAGQATRISYLIDGVPAEREGLVRPEGDGMVLFVKAVAGLNLEEHRKPQRGQIVAAIGENKYKVVVETAGSTAGERLRLRVIGLEGLGKVQDLGFTAKQMEVVRKVMEAPHGLVLLSGPRNSGLTTTIYSFTRSHDAFLQNIQTLEYDHEIEVDNVTQHLYSQGGDRKFIANLQKLVRSDPDIVILPELREGEAAELVCKVAAGKMKVYVSMPADDVFGALKRWIALVGDKALVAESLAMATNQRLVRRLCGECKQPYKPDAAMLRKLNMPADAVLHRQPEPQYDKHGNPIICQACQGTGYDGRVGVFDTLIVDKELRQVLKSASSMSEVQSFAVKRGGLGLQTQAIQKVLDGTTSIQEVVRVIRGGQARSGKAAAQPQPKPRPRSKSRPKKPTA